MLLSRSSTTNENEICCNLTISLPATSKTSLMAPVAYTAGKACNFCFPSDGEALVPHCSTGGNEQPHKSACLVPGECAFFSETDTACLALSGSAGVFPVLVGWWLCLHPGTRSSTPSPQARSEPPARHGPSAQQDPSPASFPRPGAAHPAAQDDSALSGK